MTLNQIKEAVEAGKTVYWVNPAYRVIKDNIDQWLIHCTFNNHYWGLTHRDGVTMNEKPEDFHVLEPKEYTVEVVEQVLYKVAVTANNVEEARAEALRDFLENGPHIFFVSVLERSVDVITGDV
jgi:hypothetical protein